MSTQVIHSESRRERLEARISPELKLRLQYAANLQGSSLTEFLLRSAEQAANDIIERQHIIRFAAEDSRAFITALLSPSKPNKMLRTAFSRYKKNISSQ